MDPEKLGKIGSKLLKLNNILHKEIPSFKSGKIDKFLRLEHGLFVFFRILCQIRRKRLLDSLVEIKIAGEKRRAMKKILKNLLNFCETAHNLKKHRYLLNWRLLSQKGKSIKTVDLLRLFQNIVKRKKLDYFFDWKRFSLVRRKKPQSLKIDNWIQGLVKLDYYFNKFVILAQIVFLNHLKEIRSLELGREKTLNLVFIRFKRKIRAFGMMKLKENMRKCRGLEDFEEVFRYLRLKKKAWAFYQIIMLQGEEELKERLEKMIENLEKIGKKEAFDEFQRNFKRKRLDEIIEKIIRERKVDVLQKIRLFVRRAQGNQWKIEDLFRILQKLLKKKGFQKLIVREKKLQAANTMKTTLLEIIKEDFKDFIKKIGEFSIGKEENMKKIEDLMRILDKIDKRLGFQALIENKRKSIAAENIKDLLNIKIKETFEDFISKIDDFSAGKEEENLKEIENLKKAEDLEKILEKINKRNGFQALIENKRKSLGDENIKDLLNIKKKDDLKEEENLNKTEDLEDFMRKSDDFSMEKKENMKKIEDLMRILDKINKRLGFQSLIENKRKSIGDIKDLLKTKEEFQDFIRKNEDFSAGKEEENLKKIEDLKKAEDLEKILEKINKRNGFQALIENKRKSIAAEDIKDELKTKEDFQDFIRKNEDFSVLKEEENLKKTEDLKNMKDLEKILDKINKSLGFQILLGKLRIFH